MATITVMIVTFFASSFLEWRMGRKYEWLHRLLVNPFIGLFLSIGLGLLLGSTAGGGVGIGVFVGNMLGLATNELTYNFFEGCTKVFAGIRAGFDWIAASRERVTDLAATHSRRLSEVKETLVLGGRGIAKFFYAIIWIFSVPAKVKKHWQGWTDQAVSSVRKVVPSR